MDEYNPSGLFMFQLSSFYFIPSVKKHWQLCWHFFLKGKVIEKGH